MEGYIAYRVDRQKYNADRGAFDYGWFIFAQSASDFNWTFVSQAPTKEEAIKVMKRLQAWDGVYRHMYVRLYDEHGYCVP